MSRILVVIVTFFLLTLHLRFIGDIIALEPISVRTNFPLGLEPDLYIPRHTPITDEKIFLGKRLFFDKNLSKDKSISCATCHDPVQGFSNGVAVAKGVAGAIGTRNVPSIINRGLGRTQFWDGRAETLESQALGPLLNPDEMAMDENLILERLRADKVYQNLFQQAFNTEPTLDNMLQAIAAFERTLLSGATAFDRYEWNGEKTALSKSAIRGIALFRGKARCSTCHIGTNFTDEKFHNIGAGDGIGQNDPGRAAVTKKSEDHGKFKTPTLRNITRTAPYMHDGSLKTLEEVIAFYDRGGRLNPNLDKEIKPLQLTKVEKVDLLEFLKSLTGPVISVSAEGLKELSQ